MTTIQFRRGTAAAAAANNVILAEGEVGYETDTGEWKIGDGTTAWVDLPYQPAPADIATLEANKADIADVDALVAADIATPGSATQGALSASYGTRQAANAPAAKRPRRHRPTWVSTFQPGHGFTDPFGSAGVITADTSDFLIGTQSVSLSNAAGTNTALDKSGLSLNLTDRMLCLWVKVVDLGTSPDYLVVYAADTGFANYKAWEIARSTDASRWFQYGEWAFVTLPWENTTQSVGTLDRANVQRLRVRVVNDGHFKINGIGHVATGKASIPSGVVSITFDDGYDDFIQAARKSLTPKGLTATSFTIPELIGTPGFMTEAELQELRNVHGWDIQAHGEPVYTTMTEAELREEFASYKEWFAARGLGRPDHLAYVGGQNNDTVVKVAREFFTTARTVASKQEESWPPAMPHRLRALTGISSYSGGTSVATVQAAIDRVKANGGWLILVFHRIVDTPASTVDCSWTDLNTILDYINSSGVDVKTIADAAAALA